MYILDTDHLSILESRKGVEFDHLYTHIERVHQSRFHLTIVTFHEQITGWNRFLSKSNNTQGLIKGYRQLEMLLKRFADARILPFSVAAAEVFEELRRQKIRVGTMDLRIASIAIANRMTLLTRNTVDFERIPNLIFEDWTVLRDEKKG